ncbi:hypothetical protein BKA70DRAFT_1440678 [Coprinopsis sp. MPI-PUGE-AT-0042]|nr:hypothetical protein BKA70DRAFT_1440678 [Coprinopsis sp. MPI-PUGE-AT-0042]
MACLAPYAHPPSGPRTPFSTPWTSEEVETLSALVSGIAQDEQRQTRLCVLFAIWADAAHIVPVLIDKAAQNPTAIDLDPDLYLHRNRVGAWRVRFLDDGSFEVKAFPRGSNFLPAYKYRFFYSEKEHDSRPYWKNIALLKTSKLPDVEVYNNILVCKMRMSDGAVVDITREDVHLVTQMALVEIIDHGMTQDEG